MDTLPANIREIIKRKSSRDPASRFCAKLYALLSHSTTDPSLEERIGIGWVNDEEFKMCKSKLSEVMGIKLNTLNVNLRDLQFTQLQRDKDGWTRWKRQGFTRSGSGFPMNDPEEAFAQRRHVPALFRPDVFETTLPFQLGHLTQQQTEQFLREAQLLWESIMDVSTSTFVDTGVLIERTAQRFRYGQQPPNNAMEVIRAILTPTHTPRHLQFADFCRLLAMFGPSETLMLKIWSLLTYSNNTGKWLTFDTSPDVAQRIPYAAFDLKMPNCLVLHKRDKRIERVYNDPTVASEDLRSGYVIDENDNRYCTWHDYFSQQPIEPVSVSYY